MRREPWILVLALGATLAASGCSDRLSASGTVLRLGHFPNVTHAHGLIAHQLSRRQQGWFEARLGPDVRIEWYTYNAGPTAMEALLAGSLDATYVGPSPALNAHLKTEGADIRVVAGATRGGAALVVHDDGPIKVPADFRGRCIATPQFGNTQDVACRAWLRTQGFTVTQTGGDVLVRPTENPDQLGLFQQGALDAAWTVEPWVSRLELEAGGRIFLEEETALTTVLATSARFLRDQGDLARRLVLAHQELTAWMRSHPREAQDLVAAELRAETTRAMSGALLDRCWPRLRFEDAISVADFTAYAEAAQQAGFLKHVGDLSRLVEKQQ